MQFTMKVGHEANFDNRTAETVAEVAEPNPTPACTSATKRSADPA
jgi:hypothetical protein